jgi:MYXO-CTERM domain-containing protein
VQSDFFSTIENATYAYWVRGDGSGSERTFNGQSYYSLSSFGPSLSVTLSTVAETADFGAGPVAGQVTQFVVVPEPAGLAFAAAAAAAAWLWRRRHAAA